MAVPHKMSRLEVKIKSIEDLPNELINKIFHHLDEWDVIHIGLAYKRLSRYKAQGDRIGRKVLLFMVTIPHYSNIIFAISLLFFLFLHILIGARILLGRGNDVERLYILTKNNAVSSVVSTVYS